MESRPMESRFIELASTNLSDQAFFDDVFLDYIHSTYSSRDNCIEDLSRLRYIFNQKDESTQIHLRDKLEYLLYRCHKREQEIAIAQKIILKRKIDHMEEQIQELIQRIDVLTEQLIVKPIRFHE